MKHLGNRFRSFLAGGTMRTVSRGVSATNSVFSLRYVRNGPSTDTPIVVIPGGPGLGSIVPYRGLRRFAATGGLDLIFIEHRGVGFSRNDASGSPLSQDEMTISAVLDDIAAVLDNEGIDRAYIAGSSYGSYLASAFGTRYPNRVAGMLLDSALQSTTDLAIERERIRSLFCKQNTQTAALIEQLRQHSQIPERVLLDCVRAAYELGGESLLITTLTLRLRNKRSLAWKLLSQYATRDESITSIPYYYEFERTGTIGFRELNYGAEPDGQPLDPALTYAPLQQFFPTFAGEPYDLRDEAQKFSWPLVTLVGELDVRTPPTVAARVTASAPCATTLTIQNGHSALDTHPIAFLNAVRFLSLGKSEQLKHLGPRLDALPKRGHAAIFLRVLHACCALENAIPTARKQAK